MTLEKLFARVVPALERTGVQYMLTGSVASSLHGSPRSTRDLDVVIAPSHEQLLELVSELSKLDYFADEQQATRAFLLRSQFNVIDNVTGWKVDFIFREDSEYGRVAFKRRMVAKISSQNVQVATPEDVLIAKLRWAKLSGSNRQLEDAAGVLSTQRSSLDMKYVENWVRQLHLQNEWKQVRQARH